MMRPHYQRAMRVVGCGLLFAVLMIVPAEDAGAWIRFLGARRNDVVYDVAADADGNALAALNRGGRSPTWEIVKLGPDGSTLFRTELRAIGAGSPRAISADAGGNVFVAGAFRQPGISGEFAIAKFSPAGSLLWLRVLGQQSEGVARALALAPDGGVIVAGHLRTPLGVQQPLVARWNAAGILQWARVIPPGDPIDANADFNAVALGAGGDVFVAGHAANIITHRDARVVRLNGATGAPIWTSDLDGTANGRDVAVDLAMDGDQAIVTGSLRTPNGGPDFVVWKLDETGQLLWRRPIRAGDRRSVETGRRVLLLAGGEIAACGTRGGGGFGLDYAVARLNAAGQLLWVRTMTGAGRRTDIATDLGALPDGSIVVTGTLTGPRRPGDTQLTTRWDAGGSLLWDNRWTGKIKKSSRFTARLAVDPNGDVLLSASFKQRRRKLDALIRKVRSADGGDL